MTHIIMTEEITQIDIDQIVAIEEININNIVVDQGTNKIIRQEILDAMQDHTKISEDKLVEKNTKVINRTKVMAEKEGV